MKQKNFNQGVLAKSSKAVVRLLALVLAFLATAPAMAQQSVLVKYQGARPTISDFVTAITSSNNLSEAMGGVRENWNRRKAGRQLTNGAAFIVDVRSGYVRYDIRHSASEHGYTEFCYWNCDDGKHKIVAVNTGYEINGKPIDAEITFLAFYRYDNQTKRLVRIDNDDLGADITSSSVVTYELPRQGKDIKAIMHNDKTPVTVMLRWNGAGFAKDAKAGGTLGKVVKYDNEEYIRVSTAEQFLNALGSERNILVAANTVINLTPLLDDQSKFRTNFRMWLPDATAINEGKSCVVSEEVFDGRQLTLVGFKQLVIKGEQNSKLVVEPRYAFCLRFVNCEQCLVENLTIGHTEGGYCEGGVIGITGGWRNVVKDCSLYGCGTYGLDITGTNSFSMISSEIHDCTYGIMLLNSSEAVHFTNCDFFNNKEFTLVESRACNGLVFEKCRFYANKGDAPLFGCDREFYLLDCTVYHPTENLGTMNMCDQTTNGHPNTFNPNPYANISTRAVGPDQR